MLAIWHTHSPQTPDPERVIEMMNQAGLELMKEVEKIEAERDQARANWRDQEAMLDQARESISAALEGVPEHDEHAGWWWEGAVKAIRALRESHDVR